MSLPGLLSMDLRAEWIEDEPAWIENAAQVIDHARASNWPIAHCYRAFGAKPGVAKGAILPACAPGPDEPVFAVAKRSAIEDERLLEWVLAKRTCFIVGAVVSRAGLATLVAASEADRPFALVADAIGASFDADAQTRASAPAHLVSMAAFATDLRGMIRGQENKVVEFEVRRQAMNRRGS